MRRLLPPLLVLVSLPAWSDDLRHLQSVGGARYHRVESEIVGRPYHVYVKLTAGGEAADSESYPTIYVLDGGELLPLLASYARYLSFGEEIPDCILVGISYGGHTVEQGNFRSTDYTAPSAERAYWGGATKFQAFLEKELIPLVEREHPSDPERRVVFGHSLGGQFVLYTALTKPDLFWGHIASNPALHRNLPFFLERHEPASATGRSRLFVGSGTLDDPRFRDPALEWIRTWTSRADKPWTLRTEDLEGHTHMSAPPASFRRGARWLFSGD